MERLTLATLDFDEVTRLDSKNWIGWLGSCWTRAAANSQLDKALADCNAALVLKPEDPSVLDGRGFVYFRQASYSKALEDFNVAMRKDPNAAAILYKRGLTKLRMGNTASGRADIVNALKMHPRAGDDMTRLGLMP